MEKRISSEILQSYPCYDKRKVDDLLAAEADADTRKIVVLDDDPTGIQTVHDVSVYTDWSLESIGRGFEEKNKLFFILTNSRGFTKEQTAKAHWEIGKRVDLTAKEKGLEYLIVSRGDSTLRGHYPLETEVLKEVQEEQNPWKVDGEILCPFFSEGGRFTIDNVHYVQYGSELVPAGETEFAGMLVERFSGYHRQSYGGCKVGVGDVLIGATALAADYNGAAKASHVKDKLIEMTHLNETLFSCGVACSCEGCKTKSGNYIIDLLLANVCKQNITRFPYEIVRLAEDIAGGLMVTLPSEKDFNTAELKPYIEKYLVGVEGVSVEDRMRIMRLIENISLGTAAVGYRTESMHGAGSPQAQRIMISRQSNLEQKKELAKNIANIKKD